MLNRLRHAAHLARFVLAWFVLSIGVAVASPMVAPQAMELICAGSGAIKLLVQTDDGAKELPSHAPDCPLCVQVATPPPAGLSVAVRSPGFLPVVAPASCPAVCHAGAPIPARGPPLA